MYATFLSCCLMTVAEYRSCFSRLKLMPFVRSVIYAKLYVSYNDLVVRKINIHDGDSLTTFLQWISYFTNQASWKREADSWVSPPPCLLPPSLGSASRLTTDQYASALIYTKQMKKKLPCMMQPASLQKCIFRASLNQVHPQSNWFKLCVLVFHSITCGWRVESAAPEENRRKKGGKDRGQNTDCFREREIEIIKQRKAWVQTVEKFCKTLAKSGKLKWISLEFY